MVFDDTKELLEKTENIILDVYEGKRRWLKKIDKIVNSNTVGFIFSANNSVLLKRIFFIGIVVFAFFSLFLNITIIQIIMNAIFSLLIAIILAPLSIFSKSMDDDVRSEDIEQIKKEIKEKNYQKLKFRQ